MKKYYSISEVSDILQILPHQLRYLEKTNLKFCVFKIKGRRYYTQENIDLIRSCGSLKSECVITMLKRVESLIGKFKNILNKNLSHGFAQR